MPRTTNWPANVNYDVLMRLTGKSRNGLQQDFSRNYFNPDDLESLVCYLARHATLELRTKMLMFSLAREVDYTPAEKGHRKGETKAKLKMSRQKKT